MRYESDGDALQSATISETDSDRAGEPFWPQDITCDEIDDEDFCDMLPAALVAMASKSKRRQADLNAVLRRERLMAAPDRVRMALRRLEDASCIRGLFPDTTAGCS